MYSVLINFLDWLWRVYLLSISLITSRLILVTVIIAAEKKRQSCFAPRRFILAGLSSSGSAKLDKLSACLLPLFSSCPTALLPLSTFIRTLTSLLFYLFRRLVDEDDELSEVQPDAVPPEVREWLASTFTRQLATSRRRTDEKPKFRSVAHVIRAGIFVDRMYRRVTNTALMQFPNEVVRVLKVKRLHVRRILWRK